MNDAQSIHVRCVLFLSTLGVAAASNGCSDGSGISDGPKAYVGLFGDSALAVVDLASSRTLTTIPVSSPDGIAITPDGAKVYVSSNNTGAVHVIDTQTDQTKTTIPVGMQPAGLSITPDGKYLIASVQGDGQAVIIDTGTDAVVASAPVAKAHGSGLSPDGAFAFVASQLSDAPALDTIHVPDGTAGPALPLDAAPRALCEVGGKLYASVVGSAAIHVLDPSNGQLGTSIETAGSPHDIRPTTDNTRILTVSQTAGELELIDPNSAAIVGHVTTGTMPHWIALSANGEFAYVTNEGDNNLAVVDLATTAVQRKIPLGNAPRKIVVQPYNPDRQ